MSLAEEILNDNIAKRMLQEPKRKGFLDYVFSPRHKLKRKEKHTTKTVKKEKHTIEEYYP